MMRNDICKTLQQVCLRLSDRPFLNRALASLAVSSCLILGGCDDAFDTDAASEEISDLADSAKQVTSTSDSPSSSMPMKAPDSKDIVFKDEVETNAEVPDGLDGLVFVDADGEHVSLENYLGKKNVVLVFTEGFSGGMLCPFCKTQTSRLIGNYDKFQALDTEILVVYPGSRDHLDEFIASAQEQANRDLPFPLVLDKDLSVVSYFKIESNLAHPSTFIIDKAGNVRLAYVGSDMSADRPSVSALLDVIKSANDR